MTKHNDNDKIEMRAKELIQLMRVNKNFKEEICRLIDCYKEVNCAVL